MAITLYYKDANGEFKPFIETEDISETTQGTLSQANEVLKHLKRYGSITSLEAIKYFNATRLSAIIFSLRKRGYIINTVMLSGKTKYNRPSRYGKYVYVGKK